MDTSFYTKPYTAHLAFHLIIKANHEDKKFIFNCQEITLRRGEMITGRKALSKETGLSEQETRTSLKILANSGFLTIKSTNRFSLIRIEKYNDYQISSEKSTNKLTNKQPTSNQQATTNNNDKNVKNENKTPSATRQALDYFTSTYQEKFKQPYVAAFGKDCTILKGLLNMFTIDELKQKIDMFFTIEDDFLSKAGYSVGTFKTKINSLINKPESKWKAGHFA
jgi:hypothetical protein